MIAVSALTEVRKTHNPCRVQVLRKIGSDDFRSLNLLSSPVFKILINRKVPRRRAYTVIKRAKSKLRVSTSEWPHMLLPKMARPVIVR